MTRSPALAGSTSFHAGSGDDTIVVPDLGFRLVDGGLGTDTLKFTGSGRTFDLHTVSSTTANSYHSLVMLGNAGDQLQLIGFDLDGAGGNPPVSGWALQSSDANLDCSASGVYDIYDLIQGTTHIASVAVHHDVTVDATQHAAFLV